MSGSMPDYRSHIPQDHTPSQQDRSRKFGAKKMANMIKGYEPVRTWIPSSLLLAWDHIYTTKLGPFIDFWGQDPLSENGVAYFHAFHEYMKEILKVTSKTIRERNRIRPTTSVFTDQIEDELINKLDWIFRAQVFWIKEKLPWMTPLLGVAWIVDVVNKFSMHEIALEEV
jgi:hypothetical protein